MAINKEVIKKEIGYGLRNVSRWCAREFLHHVFPSPFPSSFSSLPFCCSSFLFSALLLLAPSAPTHSY